MKTKYGYTHNDKAMQNNDKVLKQYMIPIIIKLISELSRNNDRKK